jgi:hypothetical protein
MAQQPELAAFTWPKHKAVRRQLHVLSKIISRTVTNAKRRHGNRPLKDDGEDAAPDFRQERCSARRASFSTASARPHEARR